MKPWDGAIVCYTCLPCLKLNLDLLHGEIVSSNTLSHKLAHQGSDPYWICLWDDTATGVMISNNKVYSVIKLQQTWVTFKQTILRESKLIM